MVEEDKSGRSQGKIISNIGRWEETGNGEVRLIASRCTSCGETLFPEQDICPRCMGKAMEEVRVEGPAQLYSYTVVHQVPAGFPQPLVVGYGELPGTVLVFAPIDVDQEEVKDLKSGTLLSLYSGVTRVDHNGEPMISYRFRPLTRREGVHHA